MNKYRVYYDEHTTYAVTIDANNEEEAIDIWKSGYYNSEPVVVSSYTDYNDIEVINE